MDTLNIAGRTVGHGQPPYIVAEIGANHNGDMDLCFQLIDAAQANGADAVKFQSWSKSSLISAREYERNTRYVHGDAPTLEQAVEQYQLSPQQHREIAAYCQQCGIVFFSSCFAPEEVDLLESLDVPAFKIASMDVNHLPLLKYVARTGRPVVLSVGMATLGEIERALDTLRSNSSGPIMLLHCVSIYPSTPDVINLRTMATLQQAFDVPVGYSDHTIGTAVPLAAVALGAPMIEKHFTIDKQLDGWDHAISMDPAELATLAKGSREVFAALGSAKRVIAEAEIEKRAVFRRRMVARRAIRQGQPISADDLDYKRPGNGIAPDELRFVAGRIARRDIAAEDELEWSDIG